MKRLLLCMAFFCIGFKNIYAQAVTIIISNNSNVAFTDHVVEIPWQMITQKWQDIDTTSFKMLDAKTKKEEVYQLEYAGKTDIQHLLLQVSIAPKSSKTVTLVKGKHGTFNSKTFARYVPERKDDFAWENDKIAFRMYGKALEGSNEDAYGLDVWVKSTDKLVINDRYKKNDYHVDHGDGLDYYQVGLTLGAGNIAPYLHDTVWYSKNYHAYKVLDNGPLRSTFQLIYDVWNAGGKPVSVVKIISIDAGSQLNKITAIYKYAEDSALQVCTGLAKRKKAGVSLLNEQTGVSAYWEPQHGADGITGVATVHAKPALQMLQTKEQLLTVTQTDNQKEITYYTGAVWNKANRITSAKQWFDYVETFQQQLQQQLQVVIK